MYFICTNLIKYENGKLSQNEISRCSHMNSIGACLCGGGEWEVDEKFFTHKVTSPLNNFSTFASLVEPYFWCTQNFWKQQGRWEKSTVSLAV